MMPKRETIETARDTFATLGRECLDALKVMDRYDAAGLVPDVHREGHEVLFQSLRGISGAMADVALAMNDILLEMDSQASNPPPGAN